MAEWKASDETITYGVPPTDRNQQTENLTMLFSTGGISYSEDIKTYPGESVDKMRDILERETLAWERTVELPKDRTKPAKFHWTSKHKVSNDDLCVTLLMLAYWSQVFYARERYADFIRRCVLPRRLAAQNRYAEARQLVAPPKAHVGAIRPIDLPIAPERIAANLLKRPLATSEAFLAKAAKT